MKIFFSLSLFLTFFYSFSQTSTEGIEEKHLDEFCVTDILHQKKIKSDKNYSLRTEALNNSTLGFFPLSGGQIYTIPVVVHIIHNNGTENISDQQVIDGIQHLNDAFRHIAPFNGPSGADVEIEFCLAKQDPNGNTSTGINRVQSSLTNLEMNTYDQSLKNLSRWDPTQYLNIWLVNEICSGFSCGVAGYAYLASAHGASFDGIVNEARWFGSSANNSKVHIHEVGHYLNLYHTFQGGCKNDNCMIDGDRVCDTPPDQSTAPVYPCNSIVNTCFTDEDDVSVNNPFRPIINGGLGEQNDMFNNYMDYGYQQCQNVFTEGQKIRMQAALLTIRSSLLDSKGCQNPCSSPIAASFTPVAGNIPAGTIVNFSNGTTGATTYQWKVNGTLFSTNQNPSYNFNTSGSFIVRLIAENGEASCADSVTQIYTVVCPVSSSFSISDNTPVVGQTISFTNTSASATNYEWRVNGVPFSTAVNSTYTFNNEGTYIVELYAENSDGSCSHTFSDTLVVICDVLASFTSSTELASTGANISFSNTSLNASSYQWLIDGSFYSSDTNINYIFSTAGNHSVGLVADNGLCDDTVFKTIRVIDPCDFVNKEGNIWYFGRNAGIDFNSGSPVALTNGQIYTREGVASISDTDGNLLFYTDGSSIWNRNHVVMTNGSGLLGHNSSTQSSIVVQNPGDSKKYYVFTCDLGSGSNGYRYSEVDMTLSGGLGAVTSIKNILLHTNQTERLAAVRHTNGKDVWVITHEGNNSNFRAYLVSASGVSAPVVSTAGPVTNNTPGDWNASGVFKFSPDGTKLVQVYNGSLYRADVFDFNKSTGVISGPSLTISPLSAAYGAEFSSDGNILYLSEVARSSSVGSGYNGLGAVSQYNLLAGSSAAINASRIDLIKVSNTGFGTMQMGPDGRIYVAREGAFDVGIPYLGVINSPSVLGVGCNYQNNGFYLAGRTALLGLPNFIPSYFSEPDFTFEYSQECNSTLVNFTLQSLDSVSTWKWIFGDPATGSNDTSYLRNPSHDFSSIGSFQVRVIRISACGNNDTIQQTVVLQNNPVPSISIADIVSCSTDPVVLDAGNPGATYWWSTGATTQTISVYTSGKYWIRVSYGACYASDTITVTLPNKSKEGNIWYFGNQAGLDFNSGAPVPLTDGVMNNYEGVSSIADRSGNLLFYTDGMTVYNKNHTVMTNGTGLLGHFSTSQSGVIVPKPGNDSLYYIFTLDELAKPNGLKYSIVNIYLNGGLGQVVQKNISIYTPASEKLTAARHANGQDVWVVAHGWNNNSFRSFLVTSSGINLTPVISNTGTVHSGGAQPNFNTAGCMKISPNGKYLALAIRDMHFQLFDFDNSTGTVSNPLTLPGYNVNYGVEFSPDNTKLYVSAILSSRIYQFNLLAGSPAAIASSAVTVGTTSGIQFGQLQLGPDGKIYVARTISSATGSTHLGVINNPNNLGAACNYLDEGLYLGGKLSKAGLPNFITSTFNPLLTISGDDQVCEGEERVYSLINYSNYTYNWSLDGIATITSTTDSSVTVKFTSPGTVKLKVEGSFCSASAKDSISIQVDAKPTVSLGSDISLCSDGFPIILDAGSGFTTYEWSIGNSSASINVTGTGFYWVKVTTAGGCTGSDTIEVENRGPQPSVDLRDTTICEGEIVTFDAGPGFDSYLWQDGSTLQEHSAFLGGKYWVRVTNSCGPASDTAIVSISTLPLISFSGLDTIYCLGNDTIHLIGIPSGGNFSGTGLSGSVFYPSLAGAGEHLITYHFTNGNGCSGENTQKVKILNYPISTNLKDTSLCSSSFPFLMDPGTFNQYIWQDNSTNPTYSITSAGRYSVHVTDANGCSEKDTMEVFLQPVFDIDFADTSICSGDSVSFDAGFGFDSYLWSDGSNGPELVITKEGEYDLLLNLGCESARDTFNVYFHAQPLLLIQNIDSSYCLSNEIISLFGTPSGGIFSGPGIVNQAFSISDAEVGVHTIQYTISDQHGCDYDASISVIVNEDCFFIPNLITPNNDGWNDEFKIIGLGKNYTLEIYNRWNELVYKSKNYDNSFNGRGLNGGIYFFHLIHNEKGREYKGWLHIQK